MSFPDFFDQVPPLSLRDPLAATLGAASDGILTFRYDDAVRLAGHSCPTVAGAWLLARHGLSALYPDDIPVRGHIRVELQAPRDAGTTGVTGTVLGLVTGAAGDGGFKGLGGRHARRDLLAYGIEMDATVRMARIDTGAAVLLDYRPERVPPDPALPGLKSRVVGGTATQEEHAAFARLWQDRVRRILLEHGNDPELVVMRRVAGA